MFPYFLGGTQPKETKAIEVKGPEHSRFPSSRLHRAPGGRSGLSCKYLHVTKKYLYAADFRYILPLSWTKTSPIETIATYQVHLAREMQYPVLTPAWGTRGRSGLGCNYYPTTKKYVYVTRVW